MHQPTSWGINSPHRSNLASFISAALCACAAIGAAWAYGVPDLSALKAAYIAAIVLLSPDTQNACYAAASRNARKGFKNPYLWLFGYQVGFNFTLLMVILMFKSAEDFGHMLFIFTFCGVFMAGDTIWRHRALKARAKGWDYERFETQNKWLRWLPLLWPFVVIALLVAIQSDLATGKADVSYVIFLAVFMGTLVRPIEPVSTGNKFSKSNLARQSPRVVGTLLAIAALYFS